MRLTRVSGRLLRSAIVLAGVLAAPAFASVPDLLCGDETSAKRATAFPSSDDLLRAASAVEDRLGDSRGSGGAFANVLAMLEVPLTSAQAPSQASLGQYCAAAGEVMRVARGGSQYQAQSYLISAFREADQTGSTPLAARAAYRLGLVSLTGPGVANSRGGGARRGSTVAVAEQATAATTATRQGDECGQLGTDQLLSRPNAYVSVVALDCAITLAGRAKDDELFALASLRFARFGLALAQADPALSAKRRSLSLDKAMAGVPAAGRIANPALRGEILGRLIGTAIDLGAAAAPSIANGLAAMRSVGGGDTSVEAYAVALEARLALARGDAAAARTLLGRAILLESQASLPARLPAYYLLLAEADPARRGQHVSAAYRALDSVRPLLPRNDPVTEESSFALYMRDVFESAVDVTLAAADGADAPARIRDAQQIVEAYRQAELQSAFGSECVPPRDAVRPEQLRPGEVLLYPILLRDRIELLYAKGGEPGYRRLPANRSVDRREVSNLVEQLVLSMSYGDDQEWRAPAARLYALLIAPIEQELGPDSMLAIIPDGPLRAVPFAALLDANGKYLIQRTRLSVAPSLAYSQPGTRPRKDDMTVVAASLQKELDLPVGYFSKLNGTAAEAQIAAGDGRGGSRFIPDFHKADLVSALSGGRVDVLHLATHASFNGRSDRAFIVANGEVIPLSELRDLIAQNRTRGEELSLLVLSACETAVGDDEASMGLAGAAVQAGAQSAIASLWQVNDIGTSELMKDFYARFRTGDGKSEALRDAQLALIDGGGDNANPNIWAAFVLLGGWR